MTLPGIHSRGLLCNDASAINKQTRGYYNCVSAHPFTMPSLNNSSFLCDSSGQKKSQSTVLRKLPLLTSEPEAIILQPLTLSALITATKRRFEGLPARNHWHLSMTASFSQYYLIHTGTYSEESEMFPFVGLLLLFLLHCLCFVVGSSFSNLLLGIMFLCQSCFSPNILDHPKKGGKGW
jgi:hypothetical protein